jgi:GNAT superfamily N-acetyltransferase
MPREISCRPVRLPEDAEFLISVFASTRARELSVLSFSEADADAFVRMQFEAQARDYGANFEHARHEVISVDATPAGRLIVDHSGERIRIVDIALLPVFRGAGIGSAVVERLLAEADAAGIPVRCTVARGSEAQRFWARLGFAVASAGETDIAIERAPGSAS